MDYAKGVRIARALAGISQKDLAKLAGLDASHVSLIESGKRRPSLEALERLSGALKIPQDLLVLLAAEPADLKVRSATEVHRAAESIANLLFVNLPVQEVKRHGRRRTKQTSPLLDVRTRASTRSPSNRDS